MELDPQSQAVLNAMNASGVLPFNQFTAAEARQRILSLRPKAAPPVHEMFSVSEEMVAMQEGGFRVRILRPRPPRGAEMMPAVIYYHGGGFFAGGLQETDNIVRQIAVQADVIVVNVEYHLSPEAKFPVAVDESYAALCWVAGNAARLGVGTDRIVLAGDSAGGNLTIVTCLQARERGGPPVRFQVPIYPSIDYRPLPAYGSRSRLGGGSFLLINDDIDWMLGHYLSSGGEAEDWRASPILAASFKGLPPALVVTADHDPLVDEGKHYADRLAADGVPVEYACFEGTFHGFVSFGAVIKTAAQAMDLICSRIKQAAWTVPESVREPGMAR